MFRALNEATPPAERLPLIVYPNSGESYDAKEGWTGKACCVPLADYAPEWIALGVRFIGGCCRTFAGDIQKIKDAVQRVEKKCVVGDC